MLQLVDEGRLGLDDPILTHLPELVIGGAEDLGGITIRHLLTHTPGIDGDVFDRLRPR